MEPPTLLALITARVMMRDGLCFQIKLWARYNSIRRGMKSHGFPEDIDVDIEVDMAGGPVKGEEFHQE